MCFASFAVKSMATLRWLALAANACFMLYGWMESVALSLVFNAILVPVNARRLWEIRRLSADHPGHASILSLTAVYHNLLRQWAEV